MKVLYLHQYFKTIHEPGPTRAYFNCLEFKKRGYDVSVITASDESPSISSRVVDGIKITYLPVKYSNKMGVKRRLYSFFKFMILSSIYSLKYKYDLIYVSSTPLSIVVPAMVHKKLKSTPYVFEVRDLWPEVPIQMGAIKNKTLIKFFRAFEKRAYLESFHIITFSPGMLKGILDVGISKDKINLIPSMSKIEVFGNKKPDLNFIDSLGMSKNNFNIIYFGSLGRSNGIDYILEAAKLLSGNDKILFYFIGDGYFKNRLLESIKNENIKNVRYLGFFNIYQTADIVNFCQVSLVTFNDIPILNTNSPNKLFDSLSASIPIIVNSSGWTKSLVEDNNCGLYVDSKNPEDLAVKLIYLMENPSVRKIMANNALLLAKTKYDKTILYKKFNNVIENFEKSLS